VRARAQAVASAGRVLPQAIAASAAAARPACAHPMVVHGLCVICGKNEEDFAAEADQYSRYLRDAAPSASAHSAPGQAGSGRAESGSSSQV
jgi:hypothetical protein